MVDMQMREVEAAAATAGVASKLSLGGTVAASGVSVLSWMEQSGVATIISMSVAVLGLLLTWYYSRRNHWLQKAVAAADIELKQAQAAAVKAEDKRKRAQAAKQELLMNAKIDILKNGPQANNPLVQMIINGKTDFGDLPDE